MRTVRASFALLSLLVACGDDGGGFKVIDAGNVDSAPKVCSTALSIGTIDISTENKTSGYISWTAPITGTLVPNDALDLTFEFYPAMPAAPIGPGAIDLASAENNNYANCRVCLLASNQDGSKLYFQKAGTVTLTEDPLATRNFKATITGLVLEEVDIDPQTFMSTPIPTGDCANIPDATVDHDRVPNAWTCPKADWDSGTMSTPGTCNCACGGGMVMDPDCLPAGATVAGCSLSTQGCFQDTCVTRPLNDTCTAATVLTVGTPVTGTTVGADRNYNMGLEGTSCTGYPQVGADVVYSIVLAAGTQYTFTLTNNAKMSWDPAIALVGPGADTLCSASIGACVKGADNTEYDNETFSYTPTTAGTYYLIVDGYYAYQGGSFSIAVSSP